MTHVVVDACVTVSAGSGAGHREPAPQAIAALSAIGTRARVHADLRLALNAELEKEWRDGGGVFALTWLADMVSRRFVDDVADAWPEEAIFLAAANGNHRKPLRKDIHVVRLAMVTDRRLVTLEVKLPKYIAATLERANCPSDIRELHVVNPMVHTTEAWLGDGAPRDSRFMVAREPDV